MFERFTDRARRVVVLAQEETRMLNHSYIGTEHILLGLIHEGEGAACRALESLGISLESVRGQVEEIIGQGQQAPKGHIPFTPRAKKVLELSLREATQLGHNYIGTEHILLGLIREGEGVGAEVLIKLGLELTRVRQQVIQILSGYEPEPSKPRRLTVARALEAVWAMLPEFDEPIARAKWRLSCAERSLELIGHSMPGAVAQRERELVELLEQREALKLYEEELVRLDELLSGTSTMLQGKRTELDEYIKKYEK